ncbi:recombinase family protein [Methylotenera versatilis]|uniref:Resolvase domain protein n=1 Tax=Methylotenera versatilis (strain 301) TaxID=666681 RepID=D7DL87_METV0|nr:recombinase family protein [Methylotenera versatilis]ADI30558.1 Resolvase domain protein [Methylotenera versatilis 301]
MNTTVSTKGHNIGYARVSTADQDTARQLEALHQLGIDRLFEDKASGKDINRPALVEAMKYARTGDTLVVHSLDRLARNLVDLLNIVEDLTARGVSVKFLKENLVFTTSEADPFSKLTLQMLGAFAQFERSLIRERQREGIAIAKLAGAFKGRKQALNDEQVKELVSLDTVNHGKNRTALAAQFGISRNSLYRYLERA